MNFLCTLILMLFLSLQGWSISTDLDPALITKWKSLLHDEYSFTNQKRFYQFSKSFDVLEEIHLTREELDSPKGLAFACRFPARYFLLQTYHLVSELNLSSCEELGTFLKAAPLDHLYLVFASESLSNPASIVGHTFLKISGINHRNIQVDHSLSFFTRMNDVNPVSLLWQSFITGKEGYYALAPYHETLNYYLFSEGRNVWEYEIKLSEVDKKLIHYYLFELKNIKLKYFFHGYNCSSLNQAVVAVAYPEMNKAGFLWVTPLNLIHFLKEKDLIESSNVNYSNTWLIKKLVHRHTFPFDISMNTGEVLNQSFSPDNSLPNKENYLQYRLLKAKNGYEYENNLIDLKTWSTQLEKIETQFSSVKSSYNLDLSNVSSPSETIKETQIQYSLIYKTSQFFHAFRFLPTSHEVINNLKGFSFESEVKLLDTQIIYDPESSHHKLNYIDIFSVKSFQEHDKITSGLSGGFTFGFRNDYTYLLEEKFTPLIELQLGKTFRLLPDVDFYLLPGIKLTNFDNFYGDFLGDAGFIIREIYNMKTLVNSRIVSNLKSKQLNLFGIKHTFNWKDFSINLDHEINESKGLYENSTAINVIYFL